MIWPIVALLLYLPLTSFWSAEFVLRDFVSQLTRALLTFCFVVAFAECQLRGVLQSWLHGALAIAGACVATLCIVLFFLYTPIDGRLNGLGQLDTQVIAGLVFGVATLAVVHAGLTYHRFSWIVYALAAVPLIAAVALTGSRAAFVALGFGMAVLVGSHVVRRRLPLVVGVLVLALLVAGFTAFAWFSEDLRAVVFPRGDSFRLLIWGETLARVSESPWFGLGILTSDDIQVGTTTFHHPHNLYLSVLAQGGLFGLLLFLWLLVRVLRELLRSVGEPDARFALAVLGLALPAYLLDGHELLDKVSDSWFLIWLPVAIALGLRWHEPYR